MTAVPLRRGDQSAEPECRILGPCCVTARLAFSPENHRRLPAVSCPDPQGYGINFEAEAGGPTMQLLDRATGRITTDADGTHDLSDLVGIAEYVAVALEDGTIAVADAEAALSEWAERPGALQRAAELTSRPTAASLLRSCARRASTAAGFPAAS